MTSSLRETAIRVMTGSYDLHVHTDPDIHMERAQDDIEYAQEALELGMGGAVLKNHYTLTADRAALVRKLVPGIDILGALCLDSQVGGINPFAVEAALRFIPSLPLCKVIWMPTITARDYRHHHPAPKDPGQWILDESGKLIPPVHEVIDLVLQADCALATGHMSVEEQRALLKEASARGVKRLIVTHADAPYLKLDIELQQEFSKYGLIEHSYIQALPTNAAVPMKRIVEAIRAVGADRCIISTDLGQAYNVNPAPGFQQFILALLNAGLSEGDVMRMAQTNPAWLIGGSGKIKAHDGGSHG